MRNTTIETIKHPFGMKPFIPLAILHRPKPKRPPRYREPIKMICMSNKFAKKYDIIKDQIVNVEPDIYNMIVMGNRHIKLSRKQMRKFKVVE